VLYCVHYVRRCGRTTQVTTFAAVAVGIAVWSGFAVLQLAATALAVVHVLLLVAVFLAPESLLVIDPHPDSVGAFSVVDHGNRPLYVAYLVWAYLLVVASLGYILFQTLARDRFGRTQALVESYDGSVWIEDNEPTGAVFVVELPVWDETDE
jgi:hypothetical protein